MGVRCAARWRGGCFAHRTACGDAGQIARGESYRVVVAVRGGGIVGSNRLRGWRGRLWELETYGYGHLHLLATYR